MELQRRAFLNVALSLTLFSQGCRSKPRGEKKALSQTAGGALGLLPGYQGTVVQRMGSQMSDGYPVPKLPDGMGCFDTEDGYVLLRNHELDNGPTPHEELAYRKGKAGGVTRVLLDKKTLSVKDSRWVLTGTSRNCGGGISPWGFFSCEESREEGHGWVFLVSPRLNHLSRPQRLDSLGRFRHEAATFTARDHTTYLTEDETESALYRHIGTRKPFEGKLLALRIRDKPNVDLSRKASVGETWPVDWVPIDDPSGARRRTAHQAFDRGAARVSRGEGIWAHEDRVYFVSTDGGPAGRGQIFCLTGHGQGSQLSLIAQAEATDGFGLPDNLTVAPNGDVYFVEDGEAPNHIWRIRGDSPPQLFGENLVGGGASEFAGICFSPDGSTLFVNLQTEGLTLAVRGPFNKS